MWRVFGECVCGVCLERVSVACVWRVCVWRVFGECVCGVCLESVSVACVWRVCVWRVFGESVCSVYLERGASNLRLRCNPLRCVDRYPTGTHGMSRNSNKIL